uniref:RRM domain-containing protein n=1 Tax=Ditylenchus dipsaci TaxID=166011 RepID=A0A915EER6_9BILA
MAEEASAAAAARFPYDFEQDGQQAGQSASKSLPTAIIVICLSTVGLVMSAVFVGMCVAKRRQIRNRKKNIVETHRLSWYSNPLPWYPYLADIPTLLAYDSEHSLYPHSPGSATHSHGTPIHSPGRATHSPVQTAIHSKKRMENSKSFQEDLRKETRDCLADYYESSKKSEAPFTKSNGSIAIEHSTPNTVDLSKNAASDSPLRVVSKVDSEVRITEIGAVVQKLADVHIKSTTFGRRWILWGMHPDTNKYWDDRLQPIKHVDNNEQLKAALKGIPPLHLVQPRTDFYFFKDGIKPVWSDESNVHGGRWLISLAVPRVETDEEQRRRMGKITGYWTSLMNALAEDCFASYRDYICGGVLIIKKFKCVVSIWMRQTDSDEIILGVGKFFKKMLRVPDEERVDYEEHPKSDSIKSINPVLMVYGLSLEYFNCDKVFNLFCLYGNCVKVKFLNVTSNTCMVEMESPEDAFNVKKYLTGCRAFGNSLSLTHSYQQSLRQYNSRDCYVLPDQTPSFKDYADSGLLRYADADHASQLNLASPSKILEFHYLGHLDEQQLLEIFEKNLRYPDQISFAGERGDQLKSGTVHFQTTDEAIEALVACNHVAIAKSEDENVLGGVLLLSFAESTENEEINLE